MLYVTVHSLKAISYGPCDMIHMFYMIRSSCLNNKDSNISSNSNLMADLLASTRLYPGYQSIS